MALSSYAFAIFVILHVITASAWFGLGLRLSGQARSVVEAGGKAGQLLADTVARSVKLMTLFAALTFVFGLGALFLGGGFAKYGPAYHSSITLVLILVLVQYFVIQKNWGGLQDALGSDPETAQSKVKRIAMGTGIGHTIWLVTLVLMFWRQYGPIFTG